ATVKVHVKAILRKIRVQNRTQAAIWGMNNGSVPRLANNNALPSTFNVRKPLPNPVELISEIKQIGAPPPLAAIGHDANDIHDANHINVPRIDNLVGKGIKIDGTARLRK